MTTSSTTFDPDTSSPTSREDVQDRFEILLQNLPGMAYRCLNRSHWPMDFVSDGCYELCGYQRSEIETQSILWGDFTHREDIAEVDRIVTEATHRRKPFEVEYRIIARDGTEKWVWERGRVVDIRDDGVAILEGFITDITHRKKSESALVEARAFAQAVVESATEAVITLDHQGYIESANLSTQTIFGYTPSELTGIHCRHLIDVNSYQSFDRLFSTLKSLFTSSIKQNQQQNDAIRSTHSPTPTNRISPSDLAMTIYGAKKEGVSFPVDLTLSELPSPQPSRSDPLNTHTRQLEDPGYVLLIRDLTAQKAAEREAREQRELMAHTDRLNTLGEMTAGIAHEINQPLTAISMYAKSGLGFLERAPIETTKLSELLNKLSDQAHRAGAIIERMQQMTKPGERQHTSIESETLIKDIHLLAQIEAKLKGFQILLHLDKPLPVVNCDPIQIQQVILNLLRNGFDSMECAHSSTSRKIVLAAEHIENDLVVSIIDRGQGIDPLIAPQLYQPFNTTKASGMGLGLSISRSIIFAHGGTLNFKNNPDKGATFYFTLPQAEN